MNAMFAALAPAVNGVCSARVADPIASDAMMRMPNTRQPDPLTSSQLRCSAAGPRRSSTTTACATKYQRTAR